MFQICVLFPLTTYIVKKKGGNSQGMKFLIGLCIALICLSFALTVYFVKERKQNVYEMLDIGRSTIIDDSRKAFRIASLKYHPDKSQDPNAKDIFISLNSKIEILKDKDAKQYYDYFLLEEPVKIEKPTAQGVSKEEYEIQVFILKFFMSCACLPIYIGWIFIPLAILESDQKKAKFAIIFFVCSLAALEMCFNIGYGPKWITSLHKIIYPVLFFKIENLESLIYKIYEKVDTDDDKIVRETKNQAEKCKNVITAQNKFIKFLENDNDFNNEVKDRCFNHCLELNKALKELSESSSEILKLKSTGSFLGVIKFLFFGLILLSSVFA